MTATITITCPSCKKQLTGPAAVEGKKIKCKACSHVFVAKAEESNGPPAKGAAKKGGLSPVQRAALGQENPSRMWTKIDYWILKILNPAEVTA